MIDFFGISWLRADFLLFLPLVVILWLLLFIACKKKIYIARSLLGNQSSLLIVNFSPFKMYTGALLQALAALIIFIALLRPAWGSNDEVVHQEGRDILIALDVSRSMLAQDEKPNRLAFAKEKIKQLLQKLGAERVGLMLFSSSTILQCPLTTDYKTFFMFLNQVDAETISSGSTALDQAIKKALAVFGRIPDKKHKLLLVLTDGEDFSSNLAGVKQQAIQEQLTIFTLGIGSPEGAPIPVVDQDGNKVDYQKDEQGAVVMSRLNEGILRTLAEQSGGFYVRAQASSDDVKTILQRVQQFEKERFEDKQVPQVQERYNIFAAVAFVLLLIAWLL